MCPGCGDPVQYIEQCTRGTLFMCSIVQGCKRMYLSQRNLQTHINHHHRRAGKPVTHALLENVYLPIEPSPTGIYDRFIMSPGNLHMSHIPPKQHRTYEMNLSTFLLSMDLPICMFVYKYIHTHTHIYIYMKIYCNDLQYTVK